MTKLCATMVAPAITSSIAPAITIIVIDLKSPTYRSVASDRQGGWMYGRQ